MGKTVSEKKIQNGLQVLFDREWRELPPEGVIAQEHTFSDAFLASMRQMSRAAETPQPAGKRIPWKRYVSRFAAAAAVVLVVGLGARILLPGMAPKSMDNAVPACSEAGAQEVRSGEMTENAYSGGAEPHRGTAAGVLSQEAGNASAGTGAAGVTPAEAETVPAIGDKTAAVRDYAGESAVADGLTVRVRLTGTGLQLTVINQTGKAVTAVYEGLAGNLPAPAPGERPELTVESGTESTLVVEETMPANDAGVYEAVVQIDGTEYRVELTPAS